MERERHRVTLLAVAKFFIDIDVENVYLFKVLFLSLLGDALDVLKFHLLVEQQGKITLHFRVLGNLFVLDFLGYKTQYIVPIELREIHFLVDVKLFENLTINRAKLNQNIASHRVRETVSKDVVFLSFVGADALHIVAQTLQNIVHVGLQEEEIGLHLDGHVVDSLIDAALYNHQMVLKIVVCETTLVVGFLEALVPNIAKFVEFYRIVLLVDIEGNRLQRAKQQRHPHRVQLLRKRILHEDYILRLVRFEIVVICALCQRVAHCLAVAVVAEIVAYFGLNLVFVGLCGVRQHRMNGRGDFHVVITVNPQNLLGDVAICRNVNAVSRGFYNYLIVIAFHNLKIQRFQDADYLVVRNLFANDAVKILIIKRYHLLLNRRWIYVDDFGRNLAARNFLD